MLIGEIVKQTGLSRDTIRYYERLGLISSTSRKTNNYKDYEDNSILILKFIVKAQKLGFTLKEIKEAVIILTSQSDNCEEVERIVSEKLKQVQEKIKDLKQMHLDLSNLQKMIKEETLTEDFSALDTLIN